MNVHKLPHCPTDNVFVVLKKQHYFKDGVFVGAAPVQGGEDVNVMARPVIPVPALVLLKCLLMEPLDLVADASEQKGDRTGGEERLNMVAKEVF